MALSHTAIEPVVPEQRTALLEDLACTVIEKAAKLEAKVRPQFRGELVKITRWMHCYYSNLIEGQPTLPRDIEAAIKKDFSAIPKIRNLQFLSIAHLSVQEWASTISDLPFSPLVIRQLHERFYNALPKELRIITHNDVSSEIVPGDFRSSDVKVGAHVPPPWELVPKLMEHFHQRYNEPEMSRVRRIIAVGASHHRLAWIHPFRDGNGRVVRLVSDMLLRQLGIDGGGLWSLSRGLAIHRDEYYARLSNADQERNSQSVEDGRGHLSEVELRNFCTFVLKTMVDQIDYMEGIFDLDSLAKRIERYVMLEEKFGNEVGAQVFLLLREALFRGEFPRGDAARIMGVGERRARAVLSQTLEAGLMRSDSHKSPVRLALPAKVLATYFPRLFPLGA